MATQSVPTWSTTAATNSTADPTINAAEGMGPSALNDAIRAVMASIAKYRDDLSGSTAGLTTGGSATAYTVTTNATFATAAAMSGAIFTIIPHANSGASPTLAVDGLTARAINVATGVAVNTGALVLGTPYTVKYIHASTEFIVLGSASSIPAGVINAYAGSSAPTGWLLCNGASLVRTDYAALFAAIGTTYGTADGTHFTLPDLTGRTIAGKEASATRLTTGAGGVDGGTLGATGGAQTVTLTTTTMPAHTHTGAVNSFTPTAGAAAITAFSGSAAQGVQSGTSLNVYSTAQMAGMDSLAPTFTTGSTGTGSAHVNVQPTIVLNYVIKT